uniref:UTP25 C-terminal domain-containing protein n=1 Tax=Aegilops tauschii subsp. strangulata TaxID=200361 RepID=A0A453MEC8_AEGTS
SSYFEYIRLSSFLKSQDASFCRIGEATSQQDISRARLWFFEGQKKILLYSERSHFFHRYKVVTSERPSLLVMMCALAAVHEHAPECSFV